MKYAASGFILLTILACSAQAQLTQVAMDAGGRVMSIDERMEARIRMFPEYRDFRLARLFLKNDSIFVLEVESLREGAISRDQKILSAGEVEMFRGEIGARLLRNAPEYVLDQEGRTRYLIGTSGVSLAFYSWAIPTAIGIEDAGAVGMGMLSAGAGFFFPYLWSMDTRLTDGMATMGLHGAYRGILDGIMLANLFQEDPTARTTVAAGLVCSIAENVAGLHIAGNNNLPAGSAEVIVAGGNLGLGIGFGSAMATGQFSTAQTKQSAYGQMLGFSALGYAAGVFMAGDAKYTSGDVDVLITAAAVGAAAPLAALVIAGADHESTYGAAGALGCAAGMAFAHLHLRTRNFSSSQGRFTQLGTAAGGLLGMGIGYLLAPDKEPEKLIAGMTAAGGLIGFGLMLASFDDESRAAAASASWKLSFSPAALASGILPGNLQPLRPLHFLHLHGNL